MRMFISGPIEEVPLRKLRRFDEVKRYFEDNGYEIVTEIDVSYPKLETEIQKIIKDCDKEEDLISWLVASTKKAWVMAKCDALFLLPDWRECHTSIILFIAARKLEMPVFVDDGSAIKLANEDEIQRWFENQID